MHHSTDKIRLQLAAERNQERNYKINYRNITTFLFFLMMLLFVCFEICVLLFLDGHVSQKTAWLIVHGIQLTMHHAFSVH